jgi:7-cyano-7-deazaguanine synthase in queuosine biosynthesis
MKILCTLSGGSDSAYAAFEAQRRWPWETFHSLFVDYGQPEVAPELQASVKVHNKLGFRPENWHDVRLQWLYKLTDRDKKDTNSLYVPHRNLVIASIGAAMASSLGAEKLIVGNKSLVRTAGDFLTYDGNRTFYKDLEFVVHSIETRPPSLTIEPTLSMDGKKLTRRDVYFGLWANGFKYDDTFSCWFAEGDKECGTCKNCLDKRELWKHWLNVRIDW